MTLTGHYIAGHLAAGEPGRATPVHNPSTGEVIGAASEADPGQVSAAVAAAAAAAPAWGSLPVAERARYLKIGRAHV